MPERGAITLLVLWAVLIISAMALAIGYNLEMDALLTRQFREEAQSRQDARAIFWWIVHKLQTDTDDVDTPDQWMFTEEDWSSDLGTLAGECAVLDEGSRININTASEVMLHNLFSVYEIEKTVPLLLDWRDPDDDPRPGSVDGTDYYGKRKPPVKVRNGFIPLPQEVRQIRHGEKIWRRVQQDITVWGPANPTFMESDVLINIIEAVDEEGKELDPSIRMEIANRFILLRNENKLNELEDLLQVHPKINRELLDKIEPYISFEGVLNPNFLSDSVFYAILKGWNLEERLEEVLEARPFTSRDVFSSTLRMLNPELSEREIWSLFTLETKIWRIQVTTQPTTTSRRLCLEAVVERKREGEGQSWNIGILSYREYWLSAEEEEDG
ncbi:MAG TPA: hypothetical protein GX391_09560 [Firmicutes bacterium]|nr:hypothetical protein [Bacillota bacterium]HOQ24665.1 type II secretion system protein GspK [Bacillota bacterium]HPT68163.1 type II secretion system protein GspK [Bacillota bacterium]